jgi:two-component system response regulator VicR
MQQHILLVEDEDSLNRGISLKLSKEGYLVHSAFSVREATLLFEAHPIELIICDVGLPDGSGIDFCRRIREQGNKVLFLFLTALDTELDIVNGYDAGADDYITKPFSLMVFTSKVNAMMRRTSIKKTHCVTSGDITLYPQEKRLKKADTYLTLTPNEWKMLELFMSHPKNILSKQQLLDCLWDIDSPYIDDNAVAVNIRRLREKIEEDPSHPQYIKNIRGMGYLWEMECTKE